MILIQFMLPTIDYLKRKTYKLHFFLRSFLIGHVHHGAWLFYWLMLHIFTLIKHLPDTVFIFPKNKPATENLTC